MSNIRKDQLLFRTAEIGEGAMNLMHISVIFLAWSLSFQIVDFLSCVCSSFKPKPRLQEKGREEVICSNELNKPARLYSVTVKNVALKILWTLARKNQDRKLNRSVSFLLTFHKNLEQELHISQNRLLQLQLGLSWLLNSRPSDTAVCEAGTKCRR